MLKCMRLFSYILSLSRTLFSSSFIETFASLGRNLGVDDAAESFDRLVNRLFASTCSRCAAGLLHVIENELSFEIFEL